MEQEVPSTLGKRLRALRVAREWNQTQAAEQLGIKQPSLSEIETDKNVELNGTTLEAICRVYGVTMRYVLFGELEQDLPGQIAAEIRRRDIPQDMQQSYLNFLRQSFPYKAYKKETISESPLRRQAKPVLSHSLTVVDTQQASSLAGPQVMAQRVQTRGRQDGDQSASVPGKRARRRS